MTQRSSNQRYLSFFLPIALAATTLLVGTPSQALPGDLGTTFQVNDEDPLKNIPSVDERNASPLEFGYYLQDLIARGEGAYLHKDWPKAAKYNEAIARIVPERALAFSRLCHIYGELGRIEVAAANCSAAVHREGALVLDHLRLVNLIVRMPKPSPADVANADASLAHLRQHTTPDEATKAANLPLQIEVLACQLAVHLRDDKRLDACTASLRKLGADPRVLVPFDWSRALIDHDRAGADAVLARAKALHFPDDAIKAMAGEQDKTLGSTGVLGLLKRGGLTALLGGALILALIAGLLRARSLARRRAPEPAS